jgi:predicted HAD superfamily phosphohydrolase YqeG
MKGIRNVLFDLGAVLINIDFEKVARHLKHWGTGF